MSDRALIDRLIAAPQARIHFVGALGSGMSALLRYRVEGGGIASGSDRHIDRGRAVATGRALEALGVPLHPQDGSGVVGASCVVASTAVEDQVADLVRARELGVPIVRRAAWLAGEIRRRPTIAVAGTSGKSTVVAMIFEALAAAGLDPGVLSGGALAALGGEENCGNAHRGSGPLVVEADESDKSLVLYEPMIAVVLNLHRDHDEPASILPTFRSFIERARAMVLLGEEATLRPLGATAFGLSPPAEFHPDDFEVGPRSTRARFGAIELRLPIPGRHNLENAVAALAVCRALGVDLGVAAAALGAYRGVSRRFERIGRELDVEIIDDFAHNPTKVAATITAAKAGGRRVLAVFQPHGFTQTKLLRSDYVEVFSTALGRGDSLDLLPIYYPGGTATRSIESDEVVADLARANATVRLAVDRAELVSRLARDARAGDVVLVMGARDPTLGEIAKAVADRLRGRVSGNQEVLAPEQHAP